MSRKMRLIVSFSGLIQMLNQGMGWTDDADTVYFFNTMNAPEAIQDSLDRWAPNNKELQTSIMRLLDNAELAGRVSWRTMLNGSDGPDREHWLVEHVVSRGGKITKMPAEFAGMDRVASNIGKRVQWLKEGVAGIEVTIYDPEVSMVIDNYPAES